VGDFMEDLYAPAYEKASFETVDHALIRCSASTEKSLIISTGLDDAEQIEAAIQAARDGGCKELAILHCVSGYPLPGGNYNLKATPNVPKRFLQYARSIYRNGDFFRGINKFRNVFLVSRDCEHARLQSQPIEGSGHA
jgi:sialic acid synthase SpsE